jgi:hypothetical protein
MIKKIFYGILIIIFTVLNVSQKASAEEIKQTELYLGQVPPKTTPQIFLPGIISTGLDELDICISPNKDLIFFTVYSNGICVILYSQLISGVWKTPEVAQFSGQYSDLSPFIHPNGKEMYFISNRPLKDGMKPDKNFNIWVVGKNNEQWGTPKPIGPPINGEWSVGSPNVTREGTIYFSKRINDKWEGIYRSKKINGKYTEPEKLPLNIHFLEPYFFMGHFDPVLAQADFCIAPDESFIVITSTDRRGSFGRSDYFVSFRTDDNSWSEPVNLGKNINTQEYEIFSSLSPDGKYFFYQSSVPQINLKHKQRIEYKTLKQNHLIAGKGSMDIYWVDASFIRNYKK